MATIQEVYIALFGRPADPIGLDYYVDVTNDGANLDAVGDLSASAEYMDRFDDDVSNIDMVNQIYMDLFGRPADNAGLAFYVGMLNSGEATSQSIAIQIIDGATGDDADIIANKVEAADQFTETVRNTEGGIAAYSGDDAADFGRSYLDGITSDEATVPSQEMTNEMLANFIENGDIPGENNDGLMVNLTDEADLIGPNVDGDDDNATGRTSDGDDTIRALESGDFASEDIIDGGAGYDTITARVAVGADIGEDITIEPILESIENIEFDLDSRGNEDDDDQAGSLTFDASDADGLERIEAIGSLDEENEDDDTDSIADVTYNNLALGTEIVLTDTQSDFVVDYEDADGNDDMASVTLNGVGSLTEAADDADPDTVNYADLSVQEIETLNVSSNEGEDDGDFDNAIHIEGEDLETVNITGDRDLNLRFVDDDANTSVTDNLVTVDASALNGNLDLNFAAAGTDADVTDADFGDLETVMGGSGDDSIVLDDSMEDVVLDAGDGIDVIDLNGAIDTVLAFEAGDSTSLERDVVTGFVGGEESDDEIRVMDADLAEGAVTDEIFDVNADMPMGDVTGYFNRGGESYAIVASEYSTDTGEVDGDEAPILETGTWFAVDINGDGNFSAGIDLAVQLVGTTELEAEDFTFV